MKTKFATLVAIGLASAGLSAEPEPKISRTVPKDGVYVTYTGFMTTVLELEEGSFRYWFESDAKPLVEPTYPLEGEFTVHGNTIELHHDEVSQKEWNFREVNGVTTLWRPDALKIEAEQGAYLKKFTFGFENFKRCGAGAILVVSDRPAEKAWSKKLHIEVKKEIPKD